MPPAQAGPRKGSEGSRPGPRPAGEEAQEATLPGGADLGPPAPVTEFITCSRVSLFAGVRYLGGRAGGDACNRCSTIFCVKAPNAAPRARAPPRSCLRTENRGASPTHRAEGRL